LVCKDKGGNILSKKKNIGKMAKYFKELLNPDTERINSIKQMRVQ